VGEFAEKMVLHGPEVVKAYLVGEVYLGQDLLIAFLLHARIVRLRYLDFIHQPEFHFLPSAMVVAA
jgi:hypothetical protein